MRTWHPFHIRRARLPGVPSTWHRVAAALAAMLMVGCYRTTQALDDVAPASFPPARATSGMLSAHASRILAFGDDVQASIVLVFEHDIDAASLIERAFMVVLSDGSRVRPTSVTLAPASESDENRTVTLWYQAIRSNELRPTDVVVTEPLWDEQGAPLLGAASKVLAREEAPLLLLAFTMPNDRHSCPGADQRVRTVWSNTIIDVTVDVLPHIQLERVDGKRQAPSDLDDIRSNGSDTVDDNVIDLCVQGTAPIIGVAVAEGTFMGPTKMRTLAAHIDIPRTSTPLVETSH